MRAERVGRIACRDFPPTRDVRDGTTSQSCAAPKRVGTIKENGSRLGARPRAGPPTAVERRHADPFFRKILGAAI